MSQEHFRNFPTSAVLLINFSTTVMQILLIRELFMVFSGNELSIGVILANWLFLLTVGSFVSGKVADRFEETWQIFVSLQVLISLVFPLVIYEARAIRNLMGIPMGETMGLIPMFFSSFLVLAPIAVIGGGVYTFGCKMYSSFNGSGEKFPGKIFSFEAVGDMAGGLAVTFIFIPNFNSIQTAFFLATLNLGSALFFLLLISRSGSGQPKPPFFRLNRKNASKILVVVLMASSLSILVSPVAKEIHY